jgi:hypothetical protein
MEQKGSIGPSQRWLASIHSTLMLIQYSTVLFPLAAIIDSLAIALFCLASLLVLTATRTQRVTRISSISSTSSILKRFCCAALYTVLYAAVL